MTILKKAPKIFVTVVLTPILVLLLALNLKLHYSAEFVIGKNDTINRDLLFELRGLKNSIRNNADVEMQKIFPEGYMFMNATYALAWCNFVKDLDERSQYHAEGKVEIREAWNRINSEYAQSSFDKDLPLPYGAFYAGWSTYVLGRKLNLEKQSEKQRDEIIYFQNQCDKIAGALKEAIYPESYYKSAWPADVTVCVASLALHDKMFTPRYAGVIEVWLKRVKNNLDKLGLVPHSANPMNGKPIRNARGSSQSLILIFLRDINSSFAQQQFSIYKGNFVDSKFGLTGIREYRKDNHGKSDVDSGPVIMEFGPAATIVGMQTLSLYNDAETAIEIRNGIEALGFSFQKQEEKTYLFGLLPMANAFIAWGHSAQSHHNENGPDYVKFHVYSLVVGMAMVLLIVRLWKPGLYSLSFRFFRTK